MEQQLMAKLLKLETEFLQKHGHDRYAIKMFWENASNCLVKSMYPANMDRADKLLDERFGIPFIHVPPPIFKDAPKTTLDCVATEGCKSAGEVIQR